MRSNERSNWLSTGRISNIMVCNLKTKENPFAGKRKTPHFLFLFGLYSPKYLFSVNLSLLTIWLVFDRTIYFRLLLKKRNSIWLNLSRHVESVFDHSEQPTKVVRVWKVIQRHRGSQKWLSLYKTFRVVGATIGSWSPCILCYLELPLQLVLMLSIKKESMKTKQNWLII